MEENLTNKFHSVEENKHFVRLHIDHIKSCPCQIIVWSIGIDWSNCLVDQLFPIFEAHFIVARCRE